MKNPFIMTKEFPYIVSGASLARERCHHLFGFVMLLEALGLWQREGICRQH
mgnify:CR=1 FL=1